MKLWPRTAASETSVRSLDQQPVKAARDQGRQRLRHGQAGQVADRAVHPLDQAELPLGQEHPYGLDGVQRDAVGSFDDRPYGGRLQARHQPSEQLAHRRLGQRLKVQRGEVALARAPVRSLVEQLGPGQRQDVDRCVPAPLEEVVDEVEQARVGEVEVLEDQDHGRGRREALEERAPRSEELVGVDRSGIDPEEGEQGRLDPPALVRVGHVLGERRGDLRPGGRLVVGLEQAGTSADHLAEGPEADALAVRRGAAVVPPDGLDEPVDVLQELPGEARLADAGRADD